LLTRSYFIIAFFAAIIYSNVTVGQAVQQRKALGLVMGNVLDATTGKPISNATIQLKRYTSDSATFNTISDAKGAFLLEQLPFSYYKLRISAQSYAVLIIDSIFLRDDRYDFNIGDIKLKQQANQLEEVIVFSERPLIESKDGNIVYNVGQSALANSSSTAEILKSMPLVNNDPNGRILLKGREPRILIDEKPVELNAQQLQDLLESLPGGSIEKIELMLNPPPQYATEQGGVINIVTKKGKVGFTGRITANAGTRGDANLAVNVSYRTAKWNMAATVGTGANRLPGNNYSRRSNYYRDSTNGFNTDGNFLNKNIRPNLRLQFDYEHNKQHLHSWVYQGNGNWFDNLSNVQFTNINRFEQPYRISTRSNATEGNNSSHNFTYTFTRKGKKDPAEVFRMIANAAVNNTNNERDFYQQFLTGNYVFTGTDSTQQQRTDNNNYNAGIRLQYDKPYGKKRHIFSTGATYQISGYHNALLTDFLQKSTGAWINNGLLSNDFYFTQQVFTARAGATFNLSKTWRLITGVQAEYTHLAFEFIQPAASPVNNQYWNLLPNITLRKEFSKQFNTSWVYRSSIRRPGIGELNPSVDYADPYNLRFGNPFLDACLADNFDWNISLTKGKYYINGSLGYNRVKDVFNTIRTLADAGKTEITWQNISDRNEYEASVWGGYTFNKQIRANASVGYTYNQYSEAEKRLYRYRDGGSFYVNGNYNYTPNQLLTLEGNARFSSFADPQGRTRSNINTTFGVQHKFMNKRLVLGVQIIDPFTKQQNFVYTYGSNFYIESFNSIRTRNLRVSVSYQLNKLVQKSNLSDKEKKRALQQVQQKS